MNPEQRLAKMAKDLKTRVSIAGAPTAAGGFSWRVFVIKPGTENRPIAGIDGCGPTVFSAMAQYLDRIRAVTIPTQDRGLYQIAAELTA